MHMTLMPAHCLPRKKVEASQHGDEGLTATHPGGPAPIIWFGFHLRKHGHCIINHIPGVTNCGPWLTSGFRLVLSVLWEHSPFVHGLSVAAFRIQWQS